MNTTFVRKSNFQVLFKYLHVKIRNLNLYQSLNPNSLLKFLIFSGKRIKMCEMIKGSLIRGDVF